MLGYKTIKKVLNNKNLSQALRVPIYTCIWETSALWAPNPLENISFKLPN